MMPVIISWIAQEMILKVLRGRLQQGATLSFLLPGTVQSPTSHLSQQLKLLLPRIDTIC